MKKSELTKLIKDAVKQAIREELGTELKAIREIRTNSKKLIENTKKSKSTKKAKPELFYSKNPLLNDMLNEINKEFDKSRWESENQIVDDTITESKEPITITNINPAIVPEPVKKALSKDYSALMDKLNKERGATK